MPPWGGFGANTAIQDAHNLARRLALVLAGVAEEGLLDTYETERLPVARAVGQISGRMNGDRGLIAIPKHLGPLRTLWAMRQVFPYLLGRAAPDYWPFL
jgi:putative polyketide hydroxylase